jgi:ribosomal protein S18 acetylase RimI-like enzyme
MKDMTLEIAQAKDFPRVAEIVNNAYRGLNGVLGWTHETELLSGQRIDVPALTAMAMEEKTVILVMKENGYVVGNVALQIVEGSIWYLSMLAVDPLNQASGLGKRIMESAESFARLMEASEIRLSVINQRIPLIEWYERRGYGRTGQTTPFPYGDLSVGTPLRSDLALVTLKKTLTGMACE